MRTEFLILTTITGLAVAAPSNAMQASNPLGIAVGNRMTGDYGSDGKVIADFNADGTVALTFPDGTKSNQRWIADSRYFCMIASKSNSEKITYRCERNLIAGHKLDQSWKQIDSEGNAAIMTIRKRAN